MADDTLPANVGYGTVIWKASIPAPGTSGLTRTPVQGSVTFTATPSSIKDATASPPETLLPGPVTVSLDATGSLSVPLVATDDADLNPSGFTYTVSAKLSGGVRIAPFSIEVPQGQTVDLTTVSPVASSDGVPITRGIGVPDTADADSGDVVTWDGSTTVWAAPTGGDSADLSIGTVTTGDAGTDADASITDGVLDLTIPRGDKGDTGATGATGSDGGKGDQGDPGPANVLSIGTVTTGDAGSSAAATITGTSPAQVLNLAIPKGDKGDDGSGSSSTAWDDVTDKPAVIAAGATAAAARTAIGAGTSSLALGTTSTTALAGDTAIPDSPDDIGAVPTSRTVNGTALSADVTLDAADVGALPDSTTIPDPTTDAGDLTTGALSIERLPAGSEITVTDDSGTWPDRPTARTDIVVIWRTYNGTAQPDSATPPAVNGAYENDPTNGVKGDFYDDVASS
jgi:hypothetical protein